MSNTKGVKFFLLLMFSGILLVGLAEKMKVVNAVNSLERKASVCTTCDSSKEEQIIQESVEAAVKEAIQEGGDDQGEVKGEVASLCRQPVNIIDLERKLCEEGSGTIDYGNKWGGEPVWGTGSGDIEVENIADFQLTMVTYPLALWLGPYTIKDSNRQIRVEDPTYSSSGEWEGPIVEKTLAPYQSAEFSMVLPYTEREAFEVSSQLTVFGAEIEYNRDAGKYNIDNAVHEPECECPKSVSTSDFNVGGSNTRGDTGGGYMRLQIPGGDNFVYERENECLNRDNITFLGDNDGVWMSCDERSIIARFEGLFRDTFSASDWAQCDGQTTQTVNADGSVTTVSGDGDCSKSRGLMVEMSPIFGDAYDCIDGVCANASLNYSYLTTLAPFEAMGKKEVSNNDSETMMFFVATQCSGEATFKNGGKKNFNVWCLWDATPFLANHRLQAKDKAPAQPDFVHEFPVYWNGTPMQRGVLDIMRDSAKEYYLL